MNRIVNFGGQTMTYAEMVAQLRLLAEASGHPNPHALVDRYLQGFDHGRGRGRLRNTGRTASPGSEATGTIAGLRDCGTLVLVFLDAEDGRVIPLPIESRAFRHLLEGEGCNPAELVGRCVQYDGDLVTFLD